MTRRSPSTRRITRRVSPTLCGRRTRVHRRGDPAAQHAQTGEPGVCGAAQQEAQAAVEEARQYSVVMSRNRIILNVAVAALLLSALLGSWFFQNRSKSVVFRTELGKWSAESVQWQKIGESWRIQTVVTPLTARGVRMQAKDLFHSFCVALMKDLPVVPDPDSKRRRVPRGFESNERQGNQ